MARLGRRGLTLVELVVVLAIVGVLLGLLLPAVQRTREAASRARCQNHLRQIGSAWHAHAAAHGYFPTAGGNVSATAPDYRITFREPGAPAVGGPGPDDQTGSWMFQLLPYVEQYPLWAQASAGSVREACERVMATPVPIYFCPSRRSPQRWAPPLAELGYPPLGRIRAGNDYAGNVGCGLAGGGPLGHLPTGSNGMFGTAANPLKLGTVIRPTDVTDGLSATVMVTERRIPPDLYTGANYYNAHGYAPSDGDAGIGLCCFSLPFPPLPDRADERLKYLARVGAAHPEVVNAAMADGSVRPLAYSIDPYVWVLLAVRSDGQPLPALD